MIGKMLPPSISRDSKMIELTVLLTKEPQPLVQTSQKMSKTDTCSKTWSLKSQWESLQTSTMEVESSSLKWMQRMSLDRPTQKRESQTTNLTSRTWMCSQRICSPRTKITRRRQTMDSHHSKYRSRTRISDTQGRSRTTTTRSWWRLRQ